MSRMVEPEHSVLERLDQSVHTVDGVRVHLSAAWAENSVLLFFLRRFGCALCRYQAALLSSLKPDLDRLNVRLVAIGQSYDGAREFLAGGYWKGDLFIDSDRVLFQELKLRKPKLKDAGYGLLYPGVFGYINRAVRAGFESADYKGDFTQLGATIIVSAGNQPTGSRLLMDYRSYHYADHPGIRDILFALGATSEMVEAAELRGRNLHSSQLVYSEPYDACELSGEQAGYTSEENADAMQQGSSTGGSACNPPVSCVPAFDADFSSPNDAVLAGTTMPLFDGQDGDLMDDLDDINDLQGSNSDHLELEELAGLGKRGSGTLDVPAINPDRFEEEVVKSTRRMRLA